MLVYVFVRCFQNGWCVFASGCGRLWSGNDCSQSVCECFLNVSECLANVLGWFLLCFCCTRLFASFLNEFVSAWEWM